MPSPIASVTLGASERNLDELATFYLDVLGLQGPREPRLLRLRIGSSELRFAATPSPAAPFYHYALLVPGNRFEPAYEWLGARATLLSRPEETETVFDFDFWDAHACYTHDPAGNIVELIAHHGLEESAAQGPFDADELSGVSEVGLVTDDLVAALERLRGAGLELWSGEVAGPREGFGFVGWKAHALILCPRGHPWLPTLRPAEPHALTVAVRPDGRPGVVVRVTDDASVVVDSG
jgi:hypothetical protein